MKKTTCSARYAAIEILCSWEESRLPVDLIMEQHITKMILADPRDRQLLMSLVYDVIRWRGYLDWVVGKFSKHPLAKIKTRTLQALRIGILQLLFMDRIPASAAINESVQALKEMKQPNWLTGYVNGLLRRYLKMLRERIFERIIAEIRDAFARPAIADCPVSDVEISWWSCPANGWLSNIHSMPCSPPARAFIR